MAKKAVAKSTPPRLAAIDVGSNALRMQVAELLPGFVLKPIKSLRSPVRLGRDVFGNQAISDQTRGKTVGAMRSFGEGMEGLERAE